MHVIGKLNVLPDLHNYLFTIQSSYPHYTNPFRYTFIASLSSTPSLILHVLDFCLCIKLIAGARTNTCLQVLQGVEEWQICLLHNRECANSVPDVP